MFDACNGMHNMYTRHINYLDPTSRLGPRPNLRKITLM
jgi:hypothetical protein